MYQNGDTIYALASGLGTAGVAIIRVSGPKAKETLKHLTSIKKAEAGKVYFSILKDGKKVLDRGLVLYFKAPHSFTGEDIVEYQVHGGRGVIFSVMQALSRIDGLRPAERG